GLAAIAFIGEQRARPRTLERRLVPTRRGELGGEEIKLVGQVLPASQAFENERAFLDLEVETELPAGRKLVEVVQVQLAESRSDQCGLAELGIDGLVGRKALQAAAEAHADRGPARLVRGGQQQRP